MLMEGGISLDPTSNFLAWRVNLSRSCGAKNLPEALRRINERVAMIRTKGEAGTGDVNQAVHHQRKSGIRRLKGTTCEERQKWARENEAPEGLVHRQPRLVDRPWLTLQLVESTPADASLMMQLGCDGIFGLEYLVLKTKKQWEKPLSGV